MKKIIPQLFIIILITILATISTTAISYNIYSQIDSRNLNMTVLGVDYANNSVGAYNGLYYGCSPQNGSASTGYLREFMVTTSLGTPILNNINTINLNTVTTQCSLHGPCYCKDVSVDSYTGNVYFSVTPTIGNFNGEFLVAHPDLTNPSIITITGVSFSSGNNGNFFSTIDVNSQKALPIIITYGVSNKAYFLNSVATNAYGGITNMSLNTSLDLSIFNTYLNVQKVAFNPLYSNYYTLVNSVSDRLGNPTTTYTLLHSDLTISGLRSPTMADASLTPVSDIYFNYGINGFAQTFKKVNNVFKLFNVALTNFTAQPTQCTGTNYSLLSCYYAGSTCQCYDNSATCLPNNLLYPGVNDSNYLCSNTITDPNGGLYCGDALTYCAGGCSNIATTNNYGVNYLTGICTINGTNCNSDCFVEGDVYSDTATSYKTCGFYQADVCLHWSNSIVCSNGQISINGICTNVNRAGTLTSLRNFQVTPNLTYSTAYSDATNPPYTNYNFPTVFYSLGFGVSASPTSYFIARNCNYSETPIYSNLTTNNINGTVSNNFLGFTGGFTKIILKPSQNTSVEVKGLDGSSNVFFDYYVAMNDTLGVCLLNRTNGTIGCYYQPYSSIDNLVLTVNIFSQNGNSISSSKLDINLVNGGSDHLYVTWDNHISPIVTTYNQVTLIGSNYSVLSVQVYNGETESTLNGFISWFNTSWNVYSQGKCLFDTLGCRTVRTYYSDTTDGVLWNYKDWNICVNGLGNNVLGNTGAGGINISITAKLLISILAPIGLFLLFLVFGLLAFEGKYRVILMFIGIMAMIGLFVYFALTGWLPAWIIILMVLFASASIIYFVRSVIVGRDEG